MGVINSAWMIILPVVVPRSAINRKNSYSFNLGNNNIIRDSGIRDSGKHSGRCIRANSFSTLGSHPIPMPIPGEHHCCQYYLCALDYHRP